MKAYLVSLKFDGSLDLTDTTVARDEVVQQQIIRKINDGEVTLVDYHPYDPQETDVIKELADHEHTLMEVKLYFNDTLNMQDSEAVLYVTLNQLKFGHFRIEKIQHTGIEPVINAVIPLTAAAPNNIYAE